MKKYTPEITCKIVKKYTKIPQTNAKVAIYYEVEKDTLYDKTEQPYFPYKNKDLESIAYAFEQFIVKNFTYLAS